MVDYIELAFENLHKVLGNTGRKSSCLETKAEFFGGFFFISHKNKLSASPHLTLLSRVVWEDGSPRVLVLDPPEFVYKHGLGISYQKGQL